MPGNQCTGCLTFGKPCTYLQPLTKPGPKNKLVEQLRAKVAALEEQAKLQTACALCSQPLSTLGGASDEISAGNSTEESDTDNVEVLVHKLRQWQLGTGFTSCEASRYGSGSNVNLVHDMLVMKEKHLGHPSFSNPRQRRPIYRDQLLWEKKHYSQQAAYVFPPSDLLASLVDLYFKNIHPTFPVLHRDSFLHHLLDGLHQRDTRFGAVLLAVLALASRYSDDPRVVVDGNTLSSGWPFVGQLMTLYSLGGSTTAAVMGYLALGIGFLRFHGRIRRAGGGLEYEIELWNRAFWSIFVLDGFLSSYLGRAPAINLKECDVDPLLEVDDEYWDQGFVQPADKSPQLSFFARFVRLFEILGQALRWLCSPNRQKNQQETIAQLDSQMNDFSESIPAHLRWDSNGQGIFFDQSAVLYSTFYWLQMTIHRPHIMKQSTQSEPSLFICFTAARSALRVADAWMNRSEHLPSPFLQNATFISAVVLLLNTFATKRVGVSLDVSNDMTQIRIAMKVFKACEARWQSAGRRWELLQELQYLDGYLSVRAPPVVPKSSGHGFEEHDPREEGFRPDTSIEQLLAETETPSGDSINSELVSLWLAAPADFM
ncbi:hypothetical protein FB45DRAFT_1018341 [Roridomyces roridus]|uniref:Xylanolytic transcriptional activator regulatory domain-containing protein n=1 Tax=Roridomyces roridus TaxID=1738132 RepID=A0AAD7CMX8_9AGAR|nr:hypothetical protein FB45DRAFT_1018341 [Roridomyces roridus]